MGVTIASQNMVQRVTLFSYFSPLVIIWNPLCLQIIIQGLNSCSSIDMCDFVIINYVSPTIVNTLISTSTKLCSMCSCLKTTLTFKGN